MKQSLNKVFASNRRLWIMLTLLYFLVLGSISFLPEIKGENRLWWRWGKLLKDDNYTVFWEILPSILLATFVTGIVSLILAWVTHALVILSYSAIVRCGSEANKNREVQ